jgi:hypothetical protein
MLGTFLLIGMVICGYEKVTPWILAPSTIAAAFIGLHFPAGKAQMLRERGIYWQVFLNSLPIQGIFITIVFGLGWGAGVLFNR